MGLIPRTVKGVFYKIFFNMEGHFIGPIQDALSSSNMGEIVVACMGGDARRCFDPSSMDTCGVQGASFTRVSDAPGVWVQMLSLHCAVIVH